MNVADIIVRKDICIGCGVCAGVCPSRNLSMQWSGKGELIPQTITKCPQGCGVCLKSCPFYYDNTSQDQIAHELFGREATRHTRETGHYRECYVGHSLKDRQRDNGASGGMATWFLETLLQCKLVDNVIGVTNCCTPASDRLFSFQQLTNAEQLNAAQGSKYYPVEISECIRQILNDEADKRYAVIGLPCLIHGINLAKRIIPKLEHRITFTIGLACGQLPNRFYTDFLSSFSGLPVADIKTVHYRIKDNTSDAGNFIFRAKTVNGSTGDDVYWIPTPNHLWQNSYFLQNACNYCDDVFAETADVVFMDAWLSDYAHDTKGHSLVLARDNRVAAILEQGIADRACNLSSIAVDRVIESQRGALHKKKYLIRGRIYKTGILTKRALPDAFVYIKNFFRINLNLAIMAQSKLAWATSNDMPQFWDKMIKYKRCVRLLDAENILAGKIRKLIKDPFGVAKRFLNRLSARITHHAN